MNLPFGLESEARAERDGCGCPEHIVRCVHVDGSVLTLTDGRKAIKCPARAYSDMFFVVRRGPGVEPHPCFCGCGRNTFYIFEDVTWLAKTYDEADALTAFYAAEEELLRGEQP